MYVFAVCLALIVSAGGKRMEGGGCTDRGARGVEFGAIGCPVKGPIYNLE